MNTVLLCDANFCVLPIANFIMSEGYSLSVVGGIKDDPVHFIANESFLLDYSDTSALYTHISEKKYDYIVPGCNDRSYFSLAKIAEFLGYLGFDKYKTTLIINHKDQFRLFAEKKGYPVPKAVSNIQDVQSLNFPILIKPVDSFSGKGVQKIESIDGVVTAWDMAKSFSKEGRVIAEEFISGKLYSHSAFIKNKKVILDFFVNEYCTVYPYQVNSSNVTYNLSLKIQSKLRNWVEKFALDLDLVDGLVHTQFISDGKNFYLIEVTRRCPGDLYSQLIEKSTGVNYSNLYVLPFIGKELPDHIDIKYRKFISRHTVSINETCYFISSSVNLKNCITQSIQLKKTGQLMKEAPFDKSGIYFIEFDTADEMEAKTELLKDYISIDMINFEE